MPISDEQFIAPLISVEAHHVRRRIRAVLPGTRDAPRSWIRIHSFSSADDASQTFVTPANAIAKIRSVGSPMCGWLLTRCEPDASATRHARPRCLQAQPRRLGITIRKHRQPSGPPRGFVCSSIGRSRQDEGKDDNAVPQASHPSQACTRPDVRRRAGGYCEPPRSPERRMRRHPNQRPGHRTAAHKDRAPRSRHTRSSRHRPAGQDGVR